MLSSFQQFKMRSLLRSLLRPLLLRPVSVGRVEDVIEDLLLGLLDVRPHVVTGRGLPLRPHHLQVQGDPSVSSQPSGDIKTKVAFQYMLLILKRNFSTDY